MSIEPVYKQKLRVSKEFGFPFSDVCRYFAEAGHSKSDTARILGFRRETFRAEVKNLNIDWPNRHASSSKKLRGVPRTPEVVAKVKAGSMHRAEIVELEGAIDSLRGHCKRLGVCRTTVSDRRKRGLTWEQAFGLQPFTKKARTKPKTASHHWRTYEAQRLEEIRSRCNGSDAA